MCGRYVLGPMGWELLQALDEHGSTINPDPWRGVRGALAQAEFRPDLRPTQQAEVIMSLTGAKTDVRPMQWWLVPPWSKDPKDRRFTTFNARIEDAATKPMFRGAWKAGRRVLIPMQGYYEWVGAKAPKQRYYLSPPAGAPPLLAAGLWERWEPLPDRDGLPIESFTMLTMAANPEYAWVHNRSPLFLPQSLAQDWFAAPAADAAALLASVPLPELRIDAVAGPISAPAAPR